GGVGPERMLRSSRRAARALQLPPEEPLVVKKCLVVRLTVSGPAVILPGQGLVSHAVVTPAQLDAGQKPVAVRRDKGAGMVAAWPGEGCLIPTGRGGIVRLVEKARAQVAADLRPGRAIPQCGGQGRDGFLRLSHPKQAAVQVPA